MFCKIANYVVNSRLHFARNFILKVIIGFEVQNLAKRQKTTPYIFKKLIEINFENEQKNFHVIERQLLLKILIDYYSYHLDGFRKPKSLDVLKEVFS